MTMMQPLFHEAIKPGVRIQYRSGRWATIIEVRESASQMYEVAVWDDSWGGENGSRRMDSWASRRYMSRVAVIGDPAEDPNPTIHERWVVRTKEDK